MYYQFWRTNIPGLLIKLTFLPRQWKKWNDANRDAVRHQRLQHRNSRFSLVQRANDVTGRHAITIGQQL